MGPAGEEQQRGWVQESSSPAKGRDGPVPPVPRPEHPPRSRHPFALARASSASGLRRRARVPPKLLNEG